MREWETLYGLHPFLADSVEETVARAVTAVINMHKAEQSPAATPHMLRAVSAAAKSARPEEMTIRQLKDKYDGRGA